MRRAVLLLLLLSTAVRGADRFDITTHCRSYGRLVICTVRDTAALKYAPHWELRTSPSTGGYGDVFQTMLNTRVTKWTPLWVTVTVDDGQAYTTCAVELRYAGNRTVFRACEPVE